MPSFPHIFPLPHPHFCSNDEDLNNISQTLYCQNSSSTWSIRMLHEISAWMQIWLPLLWASFKGIFWFNSEQLKYPELSKHRNIFTYRILKTLTKCLLEIVFLKCVERAIYFYTAVEERPRTDNRLFFFFTLVKVKSDTCSLALLKWRQEMTSGSRGTGFRLFESEPVKGKKIY